jgi:UDP-N-acetyl-D-galactosamine dehydrogenase
MEFSSKIANRYYVGLPLARLFATRHAVVGFDINQTRVAELKSGVDTTLEIDNDYLQKVLVEKQGTLRVVVPRL